MRKSVLITGCSSGIGLKSMLELKRQGLYVLAGCRKPDDVERMNNMGFTGVLTDLDSPGGVDRAANEVIALTDNCLYRIFNNAGFGMYDPFSTISRAQVEQRFSVSLLGAHQFTMRLLPAMLPHGGGRIMMTSSVMGLVSMPGRGAYVVSKYVLGAWSDTLCMELRHSGIGVNLIEPGPIRIRFTDSVNRTQGDRPIKNPDIAACSTLGSETVVDKVRHTFISEKPKMRYSVTLMTWVVMVPERLLPERVIDKVLQGRVEARAQVPMSRKISTTGSDSISVENVVNINEPNLQQILEQSMTTLVLSHFWLERNQHYLQLAPTLESLAAQYNGQFILAKLDCDVGQVAAAQLGLRVIPTVYLFQNGQPVDGFQGPQPEEVIHALLDKVLPREEKLKVQQAIQLTQEGNYTDTLPLLKNA